MQTANTIFVARREKISLDDLTSQNGQVLPNRDELMYMDYGGGKLVANIHVNIHENFHGKFDHGYDYPVKHDDYNYPVKHDYDYSAKHDYDYSGKHDYNYGKHDYDYSGKDCYNPCKDYKSSCNYWDYDGKGYRDP